MNEFMYVFMNMCMYEFVCITERINDRLYVYSVYLCNVYLWMYIFIHIFVCARMYACIYVCRYVWICVCMYVFCMYLYMHLGIFLCINFSMHVFYECV